MRVHNILLNNSKLILLVLFTVILLYVRVLIHIYILLVNYREFFLLSLSFNSKKPYLKILQSLEDVRGREL